MILGNKNASVVKLERMYFSETQVKRSEEEIHEATLSMKFNKSYKFDETHTKCVVALGCDIQDEDNDTISVKATVVGIFSCEDESEEKRDVLLTKNTIAILFPFLRSQISLITAQPDLTPIVLSPMNTETLFENEEET